MYLLFFKTTFVMMKFGQLFAISATAAILSSTAARAANLVHCYSFNTLPSYSAVSEGGTIKDDVNPSDDRWAFTLTHKGEKPDIPTMVLPSRDPGIYDNPPHGYDSKYGNYLYVGATTNNTGGEYLTAQGDPLNMNDAWKYSVVMWVNPTTANNPTVTLFSIGNDQNGLRFSYNSNGTLDFSLYAVSGDQLMTISLGQVSTGHTFTGTESDFHHVGISFAKDENNNLSVNYYIDGQTKNPDAGKITSNLGNEFTTIKNADGSISLNIQALIDKYGIDSLNGLNIGADGLTSTDSVGSVRYDDIKIYDDILTPEELKNSMDPYTPSVPEPASAALALLGFSGMAFRRRAK